MTAPPPKPPEKVYTRQEWAKTPCAKSEAKDPDRSLVMLLATRGVKDHQFTTSAGPNGRPSYSVRFKVKDRIFRVGIEILPVRGVDEWDLMRQAKRAIYYLLKSLLEYSTVFAPIEQVLLPFLEMKDGSTVWETTEPRLDALCASNFKPMLALPPGHLPEDMDQ